MTDPRDLAGPEVPVRRRALSAATLGLAALCTEALIRLGLGPAGDALPASLLRIAIATAAGWLLPLLFARRPAPRPAIMPQAEPLPPIAAGPIVPAPACAVPAAPETARDAPAMADGNDRTTPDPLPDPLADPLPDPVADPLADKARLIAGELGHYGPLLTLLRGQIGNVGCETENAALAILQRLNEIDQRIQDMIDFLGRSGSSDKVVDLMDRTEARMEENRRLLDTFRQDRERAAAESQEQIAEIQGMTSSLNRVVGQVRALSRQTSMLAINATIEATHAGEAGRGFSVVAAEVKQLSRASDQAAVDIGSGIARLGQAIDSGMRKMMESRLDAERRGFDLISASISELTENLARLIAHQRDVLVKIHQESELIAHPILDLIGSIQFQDITRQQLEHVSRVMESLVAHTAELKMSLDNPANTSPPASLDAKIGDLSLGYVMSQQRNLHQDIYGDGGRESKGSMIELF